MYIDPYPSSVNLYVYNAFCHHKQRALEAGSMTLVTLDRSKSSTVALAPYMLNIGIPFTSGLLGRPVMVNVVSQSCRMTAVVVLNNKAPKLAGVLS